MISKPLIFKLSLLLFSSFVIVVYWVLNNSTPKNLKINEISFSKNDGIDWIEIYNPTINTLSLKDLYLSDNKKDFQRFKIKEDILVPNQGFVVIYGKETEAVLNNSTILNFNISNGETIYLVAKNGSDVIDSMTAMAQEDVSLGSTIGRFPDGYDEFFIMSAGTPKERNKKDLLLKTKPQ